ncbi:hypothetical protein SAMN02799630_01571 [Paenibacillus sp. UNCCL117]|uniref:hypothetical protein n=1 Tax=unclassified Paenibacillus TaxID=185978 RepID=UPI00088B3A8A|nr:MULTISPECIES: hypothetical protein [unclassified Paenibacillus]SDC87123.1 hypothetical protein SAMN04488602_10456 [Paenibacillus sp. cl123]SFW27981.1 hypothetical protein SAMN02799630_01571 [Paenibacillus sp. UNCCL117]
MNQPWVYVVLFGLVLIVYARLLPREPKPGKDNPGMIKEVESAMDHFAVELEEQNKAIVQLFTDTKKDYETHSAMLSGRVELLEKQNRQLQSELSRVGFVTEQIQKLQTGPPGTPPEVRIAPDGQRRLAEAPEVDFVRQGAANPLPAPEPPEDAAGKPEPDGERAPAPMSIRNRYAELFLLHDHGKSIESIAKKLGMNKGEVALILQLAKQEEKANVE